MSVYVAVSDIAELCKNYSDDPIIEIDREDYVKIMRFNGERWRNIVSEVLYNDNRRRFFWQLRYAATSRKEGRFANARSGLIEARSLRRFYKMRRLPK